MACYPSLYLGNPSLWTSLHCIRRNFSMILRDGNKLLSCKRLTAIRLSPFQTIKGYCSLSGNLNSTLPGDLHATPHGNAVISTKKESIFHQEASLGRTNLRETVVNANPSNGRVMLIDGTSVIYRAYYKLLAKLHHGHLSHADGNGDWVLTIFTALSLIIDVLEFVPSHVAVVFDHDGIPFGRSSISSKANVIGKGLNFRHTLFPSYKSNRPPTPDTIMQGLQYLKASIKAMSIKVIEVRVVSPDKDFFKILCPSLRLLRIASRGYEMVSFGLEDFSKRYGDLKPSQFVDVVSLVGDRCDNIPGVDGIGNVHAVQLITKFGTLENLLKCVDQVEGDHIRKVESE